MTSLQALSVFVLALPVATGVVAHGSPPSPSASDEGSCIETSSQTKHGAKGYDHYVSVSSHCSTLAHCNVSSDASREAFDVVVEPQGTVEILVASGSPAWHFVPRVVCRYGSSANHEHAEHSPSE